jgi:hypothetical protein
MSEHIYHSVRGKIDRTAYAIARMEIGTYEFPDKKPKFRLVDGLKVFRVVNREAMRYGWGHAGDEDWKATATEKHLFNKDGKYHEYLQRRLAVHRQRLAGGYEEELAKLTEDGNALTEMSATLYRTLMDDLTDPDRAKDISFKDRAALYRDVTRLEAQLKGDSSTRGPQPVIKANNVIGTLNLPNSVRDRVQAQIADIEGTVIVEE